MRRFFVDLFQEGTIWCSVGDTRTLRRSLARGRVPGNVAGVERRGVGERQGLEIKKCKVARAFMATISLMVVCCEIFSIEENWGKRRGEGTLPYG